MTFGIVIAELRDRGSSPILGKSSAISYWVLVLRH